MFPGEPRPRALDGFDILQRLGTGGAGDVFLARSRGGQLVAIKTIVDARRGDDALADSLAREASVCVRLRHPCIVGVRAFLEEPGFAALVYEYVPGVTLARVLRLCQAGGVRLPDRAAWYVVERVLSALEHAHGSRAFHDPARPPRADTTPIVHRDVSPSNVLLDWQGGVKVADFGIAKVIGVSPPTRIGLVKGTLGCMAPEQARGDAVDERADVYAAALLAWRLATGRVPFAKHERDEFELLRAMRNPRIKPLGVIRPDLPEPILEAIVQALEPDPARRDISAAQLATVVRGHIDVASGVRELADLLGRWRPSLERAIRRRSGSEEDGEADPEVRAAHTVRYEEVALALDDDAGTDGPTFEAHALPGDPDTLAALPLAEPEPFTRTLAPEAEPNVRADAAAHAPTGDAFMGHALRGHAWLQRRRLHLVIVVGVAIAAALVVALARG
jgi:eukaryotic-like serine/threonine-protein kinase